MYPPHHAPRSITRNRKPIGASTRLDWAHGEVGTPLEGLLIRICTFFEFPRTTPGPLYDCTSSSLAIIEPAADRVRPAKPDLYGVASHPPTGPALDPTRAGRASPNGLLRPAHAQPSGGIGSRPTRGSDSQVSCEAHRRIEVRLVLLTISWLEDACARN